jgi:predicted alpha/beta hydrolase family esterase
LKRQVLFIQGGGAGTHDEWDNKLVESLARELGPGYAIRYPRMPNEGDPSYRAWKSALETELATLSDGAILVGHSLGGTILVGALAEQSQPRKPAALILVAAPFVGEGGWQSDELELSGNAGSRLPAGVPLHVYHGLADEIAPPSHAGLYARAFPHAHVHRLSGRDHQLNNDLSEIAVAIRSLEK